ncbi:MAG: ABC transporter permease/substrate-binding protein [Bacteroidales bacterium]
MIKLFHFWATHSGELLAMTAQHVLLVSASMTVAIVVGIPLGVLASRRPRIGAPLVAFANIVQTIPSLAMFGFLIPVPLLGGVGARAAIVVLILYGLLPIIRMTAAGLNSVDKVLIEAGVAMGMTARQLFTLVELPLALPAIVSGVRVATVVGIGAATIAAAIGAGGLGEYIFRGLSMVDPVVILAGAIPAALLAIAADALLGWIERAVSYRRRASRARRPLVAAALVVVAIVIGGAVARARARDAVVVGSKNFSEQLVLGELVAQALERDGIAVDRRLNLGGTAICDRALQSGDIDVYVEYTGTALTAIFHQPVAHDRERVLGEVRDDYARTGRTMLGPLGFNNTFAILVRADDARNFGLKTIGDLTRVEDRYRPGFGYEFLERPDGYAGLVRAYQLSFREQPRVMDLAMMYRALAAGQVDVVAGDATNGLIGALHLAVLADDRHYFPPYDAVPVVNTRALLQRPAIGRVLDTLAGRISDEAMRRLNYEVDVRHREVADVVRGFLATLPSNR